MDEFNKHQVNIFANSQSYIFRTNSDDELKAFIEKGLGEHFAEYLKKLDNKINQREVKLIKEEKKPDDLDYFKVICKFCNSETWDNRENKRNPKGPDYKCKDKACGGAYWIKTDYWSK